METALSESLHNSAYVRGRREPSFSKGAPEEAAPVAADAAPAGDSVPGEAIPLPSNT